MKTLDEVRQMFERDRFIKLSGITIDSVYETGAVCSVELDDKHLSALDNPQGGLIYTLADIAFAVAANAAEKHVVTLNGTINYLNISKGKCLSATAKAKNVGKHICVYDVLVTDDIGRNIATATFTGYSR